MSGGWVEEDGEKGSIGSVEDDGGDMGAVEADGEERIIGSVVDEGGSIGSVEEAGAWGGTGISEVEDTGGMGGTGGGRMGTKGGVGGVRVGVMVMFKASSEVLAPLLSVPPLSIAARVNVACPGIEGMKKIVPVPAEVLVSTLAPVMFPLLELALI